MDELERLKQQALRLIEALERIKREIEARYPHLRRMPRQRHFRTWLREAQDLREKNRLN